MPNRNRSRSQIIQGIVAQRAEAARGTNRRLLAAGNEKLGSSIRSFSLPHGSEASCPGLTPTCKKLCYVSRYTRRFNLDYKHNLVQAEKADFVTRLSREAALVRTVRVHVSGDFYSAAYVNKWIAVATRTPGTTFYAYTRSWRGRNLPLLEALITLSKLPNFILNISTDRDTGIPSWLYGAFGGHKRITYMAVNDADLPSSVAGAGGSVIVPKVNIVFRVKRNTVRAKQGGSTVCPVENGLTNPVTCETCRLCFKPKDAAAPAIQPVCSQPSQAEFPAGASEGNEMLDLYDAGHYDILLGITESPNCLRPPYHMLESEQRRRVVRSFELRNRNLRPYQRQAIVHLNGDPDDNRPENLATVIPSRNPGQQFIWPQPPAYTPDEMDRAYREALAMDIRRYLQIQDAQREHEAELQRLEDLRDYNASRL